MATLYANPYDLEAKGFYFNDLVDYQSKMKANVNSFGMPVEEYSFDFIDGSDAEYELYELMSSGDFIDLKSYFNAIDTIDDDQLPALVYLMDTMGLEFDNAMDNIEDVYVYEGDAKDYVNQSFIPDVMFDLSTLHPSLIDFKALGRDYSINELEIRDLHYIPYDAGYYVYQNWLEENLENVRNWGLSPDYYIDVDALVVALEHDGQIDEFRVKGKTYTITNVMDVQEMRNNPAICKDGHISSSGMPMKMGKKWQKSYPQPKHARGVCTRHDGVDTILTNAQYNKLKPKRLTDYDLEGDAEFVTYREERHPKLGKAIAFDKKKKAKAKSKKKNPSRKLDIELPNSNLSVVGVGHDRNGNSVIKFSFPNQRAFSVQVYGDMFNDEWKELFHNQSLSSQSLHNLEQQIIFYIHEYGSAKQKSSLRIYRSNPLPQSQEEIEWLNWAEGYGLKKVLDEDGQLMFLFEMDQDVDGSIVREAEMLGGDVRSANFFQDGNMVIYTDVYVD